MDVIRKTRSVCPVCLCNIPAELTRDCGVVKLRKSCSAHGCFEVTVWRGRGDFSQWCGEIEAMHKGEGLDCPTACGLCEDHLRESCCVLLEVTRQCNLKCRFCFADGECPEPDLEGLKQAVDKIMEKGSPLIQLSGGEPSLRDDLPELIEYIRGKGARYVQLNSNGIRLAEDEDYVKRLAKAGLTFVFLQFDGVSDDVYFALRGKALLETKCRAIELCGKYGMGVTLVPTVVKGVNDLQLGDIIRFAASMSPVVRGVHFQPVSYFGRYPGLPDDSERYTLDELVAAICNQTGMEENRLLPSRCDHPLCGFHGSFVVDGAGQLVPLSHRRSAGRERSTANQNREYIASRWNRNPEIELENGVDLNDFDSFIRRVKSHGFTLTAMAFQDAMNLDIERLRSCSLHVYSNGSIKPFCAFYLSPLEEQYGLR